MISSWNNTILRPSSRTHEYKTYLGNFPGGPVVKNSSANAEDTGLIPGPDCCRATKPCALQLLKPTCLEPLLHNNRNHRSEKSRHRNREQPEVAATREGPSTAIKNIKKHIKQADTKTQCATFLKN